MLATAAIAILPLLVAIVVARSMVRQASERFFLPEIGMRLDQSLGLYQELAKTIKQSMRHAADAIAMRQGLRDAAAKSDVEAIRQELLAQLRAYPGLVSLAVLDSQGLLVTEVNRGTPVDEAREKKLEIERPFSDDEDSASLRALFVTDRARLDELETMGQFLNTYRKIEKRRTQDEKTYVEAFAVLLAITVLFAAGVGFWLARGPTVRMGALASALQRLGTGDLTIRVSEDGNDEITELARSFNRMVAEIESSRARIEYLKRIGAWQEMARRLAHEIKNPLTPIQLAVQEVHRRCPDGVVPSYRRLVDDTLQIVEDEVETLRHLVSEFSNFARMPQASLKLSDLGAFLRDKQGIFRRLEEDEGHLDEAVDNDEAFASPIHVEVIVPERPCPAYFDSHMFKRVVINLVRNGVQAIQEAGREKGRVTVRLSTGYEQYWLLEVDDDGPGVPEDLQPMIFDPYVTTKGSGTGLGLAIVKKVIVEHGGTIDVGANPDGGARFRIRLPKPGTSSAKLLSDLTRREPGLSLRDTLNRTR